MSEWSKTPDSRRYLLLSCWGFWSPHGGVCSNPTSDTSCFWIGIVFETVNNIVSIIYFAIWPMPMIELSLISLCQQVRIAEWSKAPDSRLCQLLNCWGFWSPHGGVGSNPTSNTSSFWIGSIFETVNIIVSIVCFAIWPIQIFNILVLECQNGRLVSGARLKALSPSQSLRFLVSTWRRGFKSHFWHKLFLNWKHFETVNIIVSIVCFAIWPMQIFNILVLECQNGRVV